MCKSCASFFCESCCGVGAPHRVLQRCEFPQLHVSMRDVFSRFILCENMGIRSKDSNACEHRTLKKKACLCASMCSWVVWNMFKNVTFWTGKRIWPNLPSMIWWMIYFRNSLKVVYLGYIKPFIAAINHVVFGMFQHETLQDLLQLIYKATVKSIEKAVSRICRLNHDLVPILGCMWLQTFCIPCLSWACFSMFQHLWGKQSWISMNLSSTALLLGERKTLSIAGVSSNRGVHWCPYRSLRSLAYFGGLHLVSRAHLILFRLFFKLHPRFDIPVPRYIFSHFILCFAGNIVQTFNKQIFPLEHPAAKAQVNDDFIALGKPEWVKQFCMLPHDIVHAMFEFPGVFHQIWTGVPGDLEKYWSYNLDLASSLSICPEEPWQILQLLIVQNTSSFLVSLLSIGPLRTSRVISLSLRLSLWFFIVWSFEEMIASILHFAV